MLNSDILYDSQLVTDRVSVRLQGLLEACRIGDHRVVIPQTVLLEFERQQAEQVASARRALANAYATLDRNGIPYTKIEPEDAIQPPDLMELISRLGVAAEVTKPTLDEFEDAHRRACLHEEPHPPDVKSDEMRDLVIWAVALRLSLEHNGAILVSRDVVHTHRRGDAEALASQLIRAESIEDALECLQVQTPAGKLILELLTPAWSALRDRGLPLVVQPRLRAVARPVFVESINGLESVECEVQVPTQDGAVLTAHAFICIRGDGTEEVRFQGAQGGDEALPDVKVEVEAIRLEEAIQYSERLEALQELLGDEL